MKSTHAWIVLSACLISWSCAKGEEADDPQAGTGGAIVGSGGSGVGGSGLGGSGVGGTGGGALPEDCKAAGYTEAACGSCMETNCGSQCAACLNDPNCDAWLTCALACEDITCQDACSQQYPGAETVALNWLSADGCMGLKCATPCDVAPDCGLTSSDADCKTCIESFCCTQGKACGDSDGCGNVLDCLQDCTDTSCEDACMSSDPAGAQLLNTFFECMDASCSVECSG